MDFRVLRIVFESFALGNLLLHPLSSAQCTLFLREVLHEGLPLSESHSTSQFNKCLNLFKGASIYDVRAKGGRHTAFAQYIPKHRK